MFDEQYVRCHTINYFQKVAYRCKKKKSAAELNLIQSIKIIEKNC